MSHASTSQEAERRRRPREAFVVDARLACPTPRPRPRDLPPEAEFCPHESCRATIVNRSRDGVRLVTNKALPVGAYQKVQVEDDPREREAKVIRCVAVGDGTFDVGAVLC